MATRASARLAVLSPPPPQLAPPGSPTKSAAMTRGKSEIPISSVEWTKDKLDEYNLHITPTSELTSLLPAAFKTQGMIHLQAPRGFANGVDLLNIPDELVSETSDGTTVD